MPSEIAKAYVQIIPTTKGIGSALEKELGVPGDKIGDNVGKSFIGALGKSLLGTAAIKGAVDGLKSIISNYADYEQLTGGVETLFKDSSATVLEYAQNAYKTAGLSANEYMETVTGFSASLLQSLGGDTAAAATAADMAIIDMADNANKMGTSMESIQNAYQGFAKQNYTMLDNLKLGYGGTKEEMQRLLADAEAFSGVHYDISNLNDVYSAIHVVQTELGITGTTAEEAKETISGSASAMKAAWTNLLTGLADENANYEELVYEFVDSIATFAQNLVPRIGAVLKAIGSLLLDFAKNALLQMKELGKNIVNGIWDGIVRMKDAFMENVKGFFGGIVDGVKNLLGIHSPSRVFASIGGFMAEGVGVGFSDEIGAVQREISSEMRGLTGDAAINARISATTAAPVGSDMTSTLYAVADAIVGAIERKDMSPVLSIGDRDVYRAWKRGAETIGNNLVR